MGWTSNAPLLSAATVLILLNNERSSSWATNNSLPSIGVSVSERVTLNFKTQSDSKHFITLPDHDQDHNLDHLIILKSKQI